MRESECNCDYVSKGSNKEDTFELFILHFLEALDAVIDFQDEWEYRRLLELVKEAVPDLLTLFIDRGYSQRRLKYEKRQKIFFH